MTNPNVKVVIVNWNGEEFLGDCLRSVLAQQFGGTVEPLVLDNGSTDGSLALLAREFPQVEVIRRTENNYTAANNQGVAAATGAYALLLNTDATMQPGCLAALVAALEADPKAAAAAPKIVFPDGRICATGIEQRDDLTWVDRQKGAIDDGNRRSLEEVFGVSGCCALFRVSAWRQVGGQDEDFHMYYEDVDLALKLQTAGFRSLYVPAGRCVHIGHGSIKKAQAWKDDLGDRNRLLVLARHFQDRFAGELVRSPWFQSAAPEQVRTLLPLLGARLHCSGDVVLLDLTLALRDEVRVHAGELDAKWGEHRNLPKILDEREEWLAKLLDEVGRLRIWRWPGRRLQPGEKDFLQKVRGRQQ